MDENKTLLPAAAGESEAAETEEMPFAPEKAPAFDGERETEPYARRAEVEAFIGAMPDLGAGDISPEVWREAASGTPLLEAYMKHENRALRLRLAAAEQNAKNLASSVGARDTAGSPEKRDAFLAAFFGE